MSGGLSTESAVTGFVRGFSLGDAAIDTRRRREFEDEDRKYQAEQREKRQAKEDKEALLGELKQDLRLAHTSGQLSPELGEKYSSLGLGKLFDPERREQMKDAGAIFLRAKKSNDWSSPDLIDAGNILLRDQLEGREAKDGLKRQISGIRKTPNGGLALELTVIGKDGKSYKAPMTKGGTSGADDSVIMLDRNKIDEMGYAALQQGNMAHLYDKAGGDGAAIADNLHFAFFGERLSPKAGSDGFDTKMIYDEETGSERMAAIDKKTGRFSHYIGGAKAEDKSNKPEDVIDTKPLFEALNEISTSSDFMSKDERQAARDRLNQDAVALYGATLQEIIHARNLKASKGDYSPLTRPQLMQMKAAWNQYAKDEEERKNNEALTQQDQLNQAQQKAVSLADSALDGTPLGAKAPPMPEEPKQEPEAEPSEGAQQISEMTEKPRSKFRDRVALLNERKKQKQIASLREAAQKASSAQEVNAIAQQIVSLSDASASLDSF